MKKRYKLMAASLSLLLSFVMIVIVSYAWYTISTAPEVSNITVRLKSGRTLLVSKDGEKWDQNVYLTEDFKYLAPLRPVSTVDGLNWYLPTYNNSTGYIQDPSNFELDEELKYANVSLYNETVDENGNVIERDLKEGAEYNEAYNNSYYVYTDVFLKTEEDSCYVRLDIPHNYQNGYKPENGDYGDKTEFDFLEKWETDAGIYGSYVLDSYKYDGTCNKIIDGGFGVQNAIRVGFLLNPTTYKDSDGEIVADPAYKGSYVGESLKDEETGEIIFSGDYNDDDLGQAKDKFYIWEPNADRRTLPGREASEEDSYGYKPLVENSYIADFQLTKADYQDDKYYVTEPIGTSYAKDSDNNTVKKGKVDTIKSGRLIVQGTSEWNLDEPSEGSINPTLDKIKKNSSLSSNDVKTMGRFIKNLDQDTTVSKYLSSKNPNSRSFAFDDSVENTDIASQRLIKLQKDVPVKVRIFIWIEGQDIDCWNDVSSGQFIVNIELAGESIGS